MSDEFIQHACGQSVPRGLLYAHVPVCPSTPPLGEVGRRFAEDAAANAHDPEVRATAEQVLRDDDALRGRSS